MRDALAEAMDRAAAGSDCTVVAFRPSAEAPWTFYTVPKEKAFDICERARQRIFQGEKPPTLDQVFERIMEQRRLDRAAKAKRRG